MPDNSGSSATSYVLQNAHLADGSRVDVHVAGGRIAAVRPADAGASPGELAAAVERVELSGYVLLPAPVEPHAHLDRALLADAAPRTDGAGRSEAVLTAAIAEVRELAAASSAADVHRRASRALTAAIERGVVAIRTHVDCHPSVAARSVGTILALRDEVGALIDVQVVAMAGRPIAGRAGAEQRSALVAALAAGADLVGGAPALDDDPEAAVHELLAIARDADCGVDLHLDETTDPGSLTVLHLLAAAREAGFSRPITASHVISLGGLPAARAAEIADELAAAGVGVVTLPQTSLYLQDRGARTPTRRGLTALAELRAAGVHVAAGSDNWRDPLNRLGDPDPLRTAGLLVVGAHFSVADAYAAVTDQARAVLGLPTTTLRPGAPADLLAVRGASLEEVLATCTVDRMLFRAGAPVVRTQARVQWHVDPPTLRPRSATWSTCP